MKLGSLTMLTGTKNPLVEGSPDEIASTSRTSPARAASSWHGSSAAGASSTSPS
jgi:hypothetical protein